MPLIYVPSVNSTKWSVGLNDLSSEINPTPLFIICVVASTSTKGLLLSVSDISVFICTVFA